jgi:hypothetical protein
MISKRRLSPDDETIMDHGDVVGDAEVFLSAFLFSMRDDLMLQMARVKGPLAHKPRFFVI